MLNSQGTFKIRLIDEGPLKYTELKGTFNELRKDL